VYFSTSNGKRVDCLSPAGEVPLTTDEWVNEQQLAIILVASLLTLIPQRLHRKRRKRRIWSETEHERLVARKECMIMHIGLQKIVNSSVGC